MYEQGKLLFCEFIYLWIQGWWRCLDLSVQHQSVFSSSCCFSQEIPVCGNPMALKSTPCKLSNIPQPLGEAQCSVQVSDMFPYCPLGICYKPAAKQVCPLLPFVFLLEMYLKLLSWVREIFDIYASPIVRCISFILLGWLPSHLPQMD